MPALRHVVVRTDARPEIGYGHFFRCLALMEAMIDTGAGCTLAGTVPDYMAVKAASYRRIDMPGGMADWDHPPFLTAINEADLLVTDLYEIDADWQSRSPTPVLAVADPPLPSLKCDLLLMPTSFEAPPDRAALTAPAHVLLRRAFAERRVRPKAGSRLLISCGGGEDQGLALRAVEAVAARANLDAIEGTVVLGAVQRDYADDVRVRAAALPRLEVIDKVADMAALVAEHDIAIGTPAGSAFERACLGLAQILVPIADNQMALATALHERGAAITLVRHAESPAIAEALARLLSNDHERQALAATAFALVDGQGAARVAAIATERFGQ